MMCFLNKQIFGVSYMDVGRQSKKWENDVLNGESGTTSLLKGVSNIAGLITSMRNTNSYPCILQDLICFKLTLTCQ